MSDLARAWEPAHAGGLEEALRGSEERFARFMQHLPGLAWIKDSRGRYVYANDAAEKAFRTPRAQLYGKTDAEVFPPETAAQFKEHDRRALAGGAGVQVVETLEHEGGVVHHSLVSKFPIPGPGGQPALVGGIAIDITDRMRAEGDLRRQEEERRIARHIQQGLLPKAMPTLAGFEMSGRSLSATDVGGDCFDFLPLAGGDQESLGVMVADASGHGVGAALLVAEARAYLRALALTRADVGALLTLANRRLGTDLVTDHFVTLFLMRLDLHNRYLVYASAGHCPGYVLDRHGRTRAVLASTGVPLGTDPAGVFPESPAIPLGRGGLVFLFTDGIMEAASPGGELFGLGRALGVVRAHRHQTPDEILDALFDAVSDFSGPHLQDDRTAVILKAQGGA
jgi:PAS domain S-box-containing protein